MKNRLTTLIAILLLIVGGVSAQGQFPSVYYQGYMGLGGGNLHFFHHFWGNIINGMPEQCLGLKEPGAKTIICSINYDTEDGYSPRKIEFELYPNGLMKCYKSESTKTFNYDNQWRLQNMIEDQGGNIITYKYIYDKSNRLTKCIENGVVSLEYIYKYDTNNYLTEMIKDSEHFYFKSNKLIKETEADCSISLSYDQQGRWTGYINIAPDYDEGTYKTQVTFKYKGDEVLPSSITKSVVEINPKTKKNIGEQYTNNYESTFTFDSKGNWTKWKVKKISGNRYDSESFTITRTITYYTDEEVKKAVSELEQARKCSTTNNY